MNPFSIVITAFPAAPRRNRGVAVLAVALLALLPLAGGAAAGVSDYPSPLYLAGPVSTVTGHGSSYQLVGTLQPAPTTSVAPGASTLSATTYRYVYSVDTGAGESAWSAGAPATVANANAETVTVGGLPTGTGLTVRLYRVNLTSPTNCYTRIWLSASGNTQGSYTDTSGTASCTNALKRSEDRYPVGSTGWTDLSPSTVAPGLNSPVVGAPAAPNRKGWIVDGPGGLSFPEGTWRFEAQTRSTAPNGAAVLVVGMWKVDAATGNAVGPAVLAPTEQVQAPASLVSAANGIQDVTIDVTVRAFSLDAGERLYVQFWRHQTTAYTAASGASNRIATMFAWDGVAKITHPPGSAYAAEPTLAAPAAGALTTSTRLAAVFNDPDGSDTGTVEFRVCSAAGAAGVACPALVDSGSSASVAKGAQATWSVGASLAHGSTYHWQARGRDALGGTSAWTATQSFVVDAAPEASLLAPAADAVTSSLALELSYADPDGDHGALEARLCSTRADAGAECSGQVATGWFTELAPGASVRWAALPALADGVYHWQARAGDSIGAVSAWTATRAVRVDATPPAAPGGFAATVASDGLTLRWAAPPGEETVASYVVYVDGRRTQVLGGETLEAGLGSFDAGDARRFSVAAVDQAGNEGPQTGVLVGVPELLGMTRDEARAALAARGLVLREETPRSTQAVAREVIVSQDPDAPSLVGTGSAVGVVLARRAAPVPLLRLSAAGFACAGPSRLGLRLSLSTDARVAVTLANPRGRTVASWHLGRLADGARRPSLRLPASLRPGRYRLTVAATAGGKTERLSRPLVVGRSSGCARA